MSVAVSSSEPVPIIVPITYAPKIPYRNTPQFAANKQSTGDNRRSKAEICEAAHVGYMAATAMVPRTPVEMTYLRLRCSELGASDGVISHAFLGGHLWKTKNDHARQGLEKARRIGVATKNMTLEGNTAGTKCGQDQGEGKICHPRAKHSSCLLSCSTHAQTQVAPPQTTAASAFFPLPLGF